jgi:hypothetical protein
MAISGGPNIVKDGLVLYLDASNTKSYPGSGTVWKDLSGRGNNFNLINDPQLINGTFAFTTNEYAELTVTSSTIKIPELLPDNDSFTVEVTYKYVDTSNRRKFLGTGEYGKGGWNLGVGYNDFNMVSFNAFDERCNDGTNCQYNRGNLDANIINNITDFNYYQLVYNYTNKTTFLYANGILVKSQFDSTYGTGPNPNGSGNTSRFRIGKTTQGGWGDKKGYCGIVKYYNRALTQQEVLQNYDTTKGKFGL